LPAGRTSGSSSTWPERCSPPYRHGHGAAASGSRGAARAPRQ